MPVIVDAIRPFWLPGINDINGKQQQRLVGWISTKNFQVYHQLLSTSFTLSISDTRPLIAAFACDCSRMAIAAFESLEGIERQSKLPKSIAWLLIRCYYGAFFAAHAILRMIGISCTQLEHKETSSVVQMADLYGFYNGQNVAKGFYKCMFDGKSKTLTCTKLESSDGGSHEAMWKAFHETMREISIRLLAGPGTALSKQQASTLISAICESLCCQPCGLRGNWLSYIRNRVTYQHHYGVWFPYEEYTGYYARLHEICSMWRNDPDQIVIWTQPGRDLQRFVETCSAIIAICRAMVVDMAERCSNGKSFHLFGSMHLLKHLGVNS